MFPAIQFFIVLLALSCATDALYRVQLTRRKRILNAESKRKPSPSRSFRYSPNIFTYPPMLAEKQYDLPLNNHENVAIDTGSDVLWVNCAGCLAEECQERGAFDCSKSATCVLMEEKPKPIHYVQGNAWGPIDKDFVCILQDGIFGLSAEGESPELESAMGRLLRYSGCEDKKVAIWLNRDSEAENGGEMTICGVDKNHYQGDLVWIPLEHGPNWYVRMDDVLIGSHRISLGQTEAVIDSGWTIMAAPYEEYPKVTFIARNC
ncbi:unnamed protein product [Anisakis simplex]|uniref:Peptidase A1 domain-containing protein n=1 Tax=Anisakis simplex TaxID=6269 RepID=A0A0M3J0J8_ANISI|nr:unnamed protein product [Anisakis simplex]